MKANSNELARILEVLDMMKPLAPDAMLTAFDRLIARITFWLRWIGVGLFLVLVAFAAWVRFAGPLHGPWLKAAFWIGIASMGLSMLSIVVDAVPSAVTLLRFQKNAHRRMLLEVEHDSRNATQLVAFGKKLLERTDKLLAIKINRLKEHLGFFLGGADKIAIFALAGMGWTALKEIQSIGVGWRYDVFVYGLAFMGGLAFGGVLLNVVVRRYNYQRDLLALALDQLA